MATYKIQCEAIKVATATGCCPGSAKCKLGESYVIGLRTPEMGMCDRAFSAIHPMALAMRFTEKIYREKENGYVEVTCPNGYVIYRLSRIREE